MSTITPPSPPPPQTVNVDLNIIILVFGIISLGAGVYNYQYYEKRDSLRTKFETRNINKITGYDVTYRSGTYSDTESNVPLASIKGFTEFHKFRKKEGNSVAYVPLPITSVTKVISRIELTLEDGRTVYISRSNFTKDITEGDVGKPIEIEYDTNDTENISMVVDGLTIREWLISGAFVIAGIALIIFYLLIFFKIIKTKPAT
jgi:TRAP-type C4-dicarboxylate transport system permease small subunit